MSEGKLCPFREAICAGTCAWWVESMMPGQGNCVMLEVSAEFRQLRHDLQWLLDKKPDIVRLFEQLALDRKNRLKRKPLKKGSVDKPVGVAEAFREAEKIVAQTY